MEKVGRRTFLRNLQCTFNAKSFHGESHYPQIHQTIYYLLLNRIGVNGTFDNIKPDNNCWLQTLALLMLFTLKFGMTLTESC
jgi:hypothetical protein